MSGMIKILKLIFCILIFSYYSLYSQSNEWLRYLEYRAKADTSFINKDFKNCWGYILKAYKEKKQFVYFSDLTNLCQCLSLDKQKDSAFKYLDSLSQFNGIDCKKLLLDSSFNNLKQDKRWSILTYKLKCFKDTSLNKELIQMQKTDQEQRGKLNNLRKDYNGRLPKNVYDSIWIIIKKVDSLHTNRLMEIINKYGWPGFSLIGPAGSYATWLIIQHSNKQFMEYCLPLLKDAILKKDAFSANYAYLLDRVLIAKKQNQIYGTQYTTDNTYWPIEDIDNLNNRREQMKLTPLNIEEIKLKLKKQIWSK